MGSISQRGFTIIETMLFLAISGALAVAILASSAASINQQRYRDGVNSFKSLLQDQYNEASNVYNARTSAYACGANAQITEEASPAQQQYRGTSECVMMGRVIQVKNGTNITLSSVIGRLPSGLTPPADDTEALKQYKYSISTIDQEKVEPEWGTTITKPSGPNDTFTMVIVRSPFSGIVRTYIGDGAEPNDTIDLMANPVPNTKRELCVSGRDFFSGRTLAVVVQASASSQSAIEISGDDNAC